MKTEVIIAAIVAVAGAASVAVADEHGQAMTEMMAPGLMMPEMDPALGRQLFASKGCVVCHSINGVGGEDAPMLDAEFMEMPMNPFEFAARMWRGAAAMVMMQEDEMGGQIELTGDELAAIIAFVHDAEEQALFSEDDIPEQILELMEHAHEEDDEHSD